MSISNAPKTPQKSLAVQIFAVTKNVKGKCFTLKPKSKRIRLSYLCVYDNSIFSYIICKLSVEWNEESN